MSDSARRRAAQQLDLRRAPASTRTGACARSTRPTPLASTGATRSSTDLVDARRRRRRSSPSSVRPARARARSCAPGSSPGCAPAASSWSRWSRRRSRSTRCARRSPRSPRSRRRRIGRADRRRWPTSPGGSVGWSWSSTSSRSAGPGRRPSAATPSSTSIARRIADDSVDVRVRRHVRADLLDRPLEHPAHRAARRRRAVRAGAAVAGRARRGDRRCRPPRRRDVRRRRRRRSGRRGRHASRARCRCCSSRSPSCTTGGSTA